MAAAPAIVVTSALGAITTITGQDHYVVPLDVTLGATPPSAAQPRGTFEGHGYLLVPAGTASSYLEAAAYCRSKAGYLADITSDAENSYVYERVVAQGWKTAYFGLSKPFPAGDWVWASGATSSYRHWADDEPNNSNGTESYAQFYWKFTGGHWNDGDFGHQTEADSTAFICEQDF